MRRGGFIGWALVCRGELVRVIGYVVQLDWLCCGISSELLLLSLQCLFYGLLCCVLLRVSCRGLPVSQAPALLICHVFTACGAGRAVGKGQCYPFSWVWSPLMCVMQWSLGVFQFLFHMSVFVLCLCGVVIQLWGRGLVVL